MRGEKMLGEEFAPIQLPANVSVWMARCGGRDQVLEQALRDGWEAFEAPLPRIFLKTVARTYGLVVDVGANTGFYSLIAGRCGSRVLAFEPVPMVREILIRNVAANHLEGVVTVSPSAVSDRLGRRTLYIPDPSHGLLETSASLDAAFKPHASTIDVDVVPLDALLTARQKVGVVKIDAEGHDAAVLRGATAMIARDRPILFVEVLPRAETDFMTRLLANLRYVDVPLRSDGLLLIEPEVQFVPNGWNHAFVPQEVANAIVC
jgi:FkbM family methyltransferase